jgi:uncharacterized protein YqgV (UPF0045/DUF77 family)
MNVQAEVSLYPLRTGDLGPPILAFCEALGRSGLEVRSGLMSTRVSGELDALFAGLRQAFARVAESHDLVLTVKMSNGCATQENLQLMTERARDTSNDTHPHQE